MNGVIGEGRDTFMTIWPWWRWGSPVVNAFIMRFVNEDFKKFGNGIFICLMNRSLNLFYDRIFKKITHMWLKISGPKYTQILKH